MKAFLEYLKYKIHELFFILFAAAVMLACAWLGGGSALIFVYGFAIVLFAWLVMFVMRFLRFNKLHKTLTHLMNEIELTLENLPEPDNLIEDDYSALISRLFDNNRELFNSAEKRYNDTVDYYTVWVHQIKTPISALHLLLQTEDFPQKPEIEDNLRSIEQYVEMVLCYLRLESPADFVIKRYPLDDIIRQAVKRFSPAFIRRRLTVDFKPTDYLALTDEKWLLFVIEQLISNAVKYTKSGGVSVYLEKETLIIKDTGIGIAPEDLPRVFDKGYTGKNGREDKKASGIGLFICREICKRLGHGISISSKVGEGTAVMLDLKPTDIDIRE